MPKPPDRTSPIEKRPVPTSQMRPLANDVRTLYGGTCSCGHYTSVRSKAGQERIDISCSSCGWVVTLVEEN